MKLFKVPIQIEFDMMVVAKDKSQAIETATDNFEEEISNLSLKFCSWIGPGTMEIDDEDQIPTEWKGGNYPYTGSNEVPEKTVEEWCRNDEGSK